MSTDYLSMVETRKVRVSSDGVAAFNARWPCSELRDTRAHIGSSLTDAATLWIRTCRNRTTGGPLAPWPTTARHGCLTTACPNGPDKEGSHEDI